MFSIPFSLQKSIVTTASREKVFNTIADFYTWSNWSPWLCQEPDCPVEIKSEPLKVGHQQKWQGQRIGSGEMTLNVIQPKRKLTYSLIFLKPWKSKSTVFFEFKDLEEGTEITWGMQGSVPIFLFFLKSMMSNLVGSDYERGLSMLKEFLEKGEVNTKTHVQGKTDERPFYYVATRKKCSLEQLGPEMERDFDELENKIKKGELPKPDFRLSFYYKWDFGTKTCEYGSGFGYFNNQDNVAHEGLEIGEVPAHETLAVVHKGPYRYLGNAWSTAMGLQRHEKKKASKTIAMYEIYKNNPHHVSENELETVVHIPIKN